MRTLRPLMATALGVMAVAGVLGSRPATADKPSACPQWEVMLSQPSHVVTDVRSLPELGKPFVESSPSGWEPFAFAPSGQLVYRRCAK